MRHAIAIAFSLMASSAHAEFFNGNEMHESCTSSKSHVLYYLSGWLDKHDFDTDDVTIGEITAEDAGTKAALKFRRENIDSNICIPSKVTLGQVVDVLCKSLNDNPAERHGGMNTQIRFALSTAWPCRPY